MLDITCIYAILQLYFQSVWPEIEDYGHSLTTKSIPNSLTLYLVVFLIIHNNYIFKVTSKLYNIENND